MQIGGESFQNRSQTKSKALFIILFLIIGIFLIFKLTQDGSRYSNPFGTQSKEEVRLPEKSKNTTTEVDKKNNENKGFLKNLVDKVNTFNETMKKLDEMLKNVNMTEVLQKLNQSISDESESERNFTDIFNLGNYDTQKDELLKNLNQLKEAFEKATNGTRRDLEDVL